VVGLRCVEPGVVAAGEARIESTVTGNTSRRLAVSGADALVNQSQVYLPINNALSPVGHVHGFLQEIGQGIQHVASRVDDLKAFIERVNNYRLITGRGFTFLNIPRSYYGRLDAPLLAKHTTCSAVLREAVCAALVTAGLLSTTGILDLEAATERLRAALAGAALPVGLAEERDAKLEEIVATVRLSRYSNLHSLLRDHLQEEEYLQIVRNKILVDIQGSDILYQIFTANILQRRPGDEAPFLEFIQRVCADTRCKAPHEACSKPIRPGCGGFGIRNFLTLFLSIEVSKAMRELADAEEAADAAGCELARRKIELFTEQLDASNPILTDISDAMTSEGECLDQLAISTGSASDKALLRARADEMRAKKEAGNARLQEVSTQYATLMKSLRA